MKICNKCKKECNDDDFCYRYKNKNVRQKICKNCQKAYKIDYYNKNKESHYKRNKLTELKLASFIKDLKKEGCFSCGESSVECLDFHHLNPLEKEIEVSLLTRRGSKKRILKEVEKCIILCANCHRKVHAKTLIL